MFALYTVHFYLFLWLFLRTSTYQVGNSRFPIWPEWNEADMNAEKWDAGKVGKEKEKSGKSPISVSVTQMHFFLPCWFLYLFNFSITQNNCH